MRIRQIALVAADLDRALENLRAVLGLGEPFADPGVGVFGLRNGVLPIGEHLLEVVSPAQADTAAGRYLSRRHGDGGYMVIFQTRDLAARRRRFSACGVREVWDLALDDIETTHLHPRDTGGAIVSIDQARPWESWRWAGPTWRENICTTRVGAIVGVEIQSENPAALAQRWSDIFELPLRDGRLVTQEGDTVSFSQADDGRGEGLRSVVLRATDPSSIRATARERGLTVDNDGAVTLVGTRFVLV